MAELTTAAISAAQIVKHAQIVKGHAMRRQLIRMFSDQMQTLYDLREPDAVALETQAEIFKLLQSKESKAWLAARDMMLDAIQFCEAMQQRQDSNMLGIASGLTRLDEITGGWTRGSLVIIGGRPSMGKTALALKAAMEAAFAGYAVGIVSLEMTARPLGLRLLALDTSGDLNVSAMKQGRKLTTQQWWEIVESSGRLETIPLYCDDSSMMDAQQLRSKARQLKSKSGLDLLVVDYLQLMTVSGQRREGLEECCRALKLLAKELDICVIALSQLSRALEAREDKRPILADLRETGAIEQDADLVLMLYRDSYYNKNAEEGVAEILVRKNRDGMTGDCNVAWLNTKAAFMNLEGYQAPT
jgi:replicative DNA helicase